MQTTKQGARKIYIARSASSTTLLLWCMCGTSNCFVTASNNCFFTSLLLCFLYSVLFQYPSVSQRVNASLNLAGGLVIVITLFKEEPASITLNYHPVECVVGGLSFFSS
jgi:hypothetical protein